MGLYRVKQFIWATFSKVTKDDIEYVNCILDTEEQKLFFMLSVSEQKHCIRVAHDVEKFLEDIKDKSALSISKEDFKKIALLHDIGKIEKRINIIDKSLLVIMNKISPSNLRRLTKVKKVDVYFNHAEKGYEILKELKRYDDRFLYLVRNHHNNGIINDEELDILKHADGLN
ncbi:HD domain-containing protein [Clostridium thermarum]|uniref:HD domain-containing protein n=1 Tax=Clostridium thermarum TaxID=1716543 RepID=UPI0013D607BC|nr:HD domain-containing protein [Clostridium thermarum]